MLYLTNINLNQNEIQNAVIQPLAAAPYNPVLGQIYYNSASSKLMQFTGTEWRTVGVIVSKSETNGNIVVDGVEMSVYRLPPTTESTLGGIIVGSGLTVTAEGKISVDTENSLTSDETKKPLAAYQGKVLKSAIEDVILRFSNFYNKEEVNSLLDSIPHLSIQIVQELPTENIATDVLYLKPRENSTNPDIHDEYIYVEGQWELIGNTQVDLTEYVKFTDLSLVATTGDYEDLTNKIIRVSGVLFAGSTETVISIEDSTIYSIESFDAVTGERVLLDTQISSNELHLTISSAYEHNINIFVLLSLN